MREIVRGKNSGQAVIKAACRVGEDCEPGAGPGLVWARLPAVSATTALACPRGRQAQLLPARPAAQAGLAIESDVLVTTALACFKLRPRPRPWWVRALPTASSGFGKALTGIDAGLGWTLSESRRDMGGVGDRLRGQSTWMARPFRAPGHPSRPPS